jgi:hypothetical protein
MSRGRKLLITGIAVVALGAGGVGIAQAVGGDDENVTGPEADRAKAAAVEAVGGGRAGGVESDDGGAGWEVEVTRSDGSQAEVSLDRDLKRVGTETEDESEGEGRESDDEGKDDD